MHTGRAGKLQKHHEGGLGADSQEGRKKTTKSKKAIGQKVDGYRWWNKATLQRLSQAWFCYGAWMYVDTLRVSPVHLEKAENSQTPSHTPLTHRLTGFLLALAIQPGKHGQPPWDLDTPLGSCCSLSSCFFPALPPSSKDLHICPTPSCLRTHSFCGICCQETENLPIDLVC